MTKLTRTSTLVALALLAAVAASAERGDDADRKSKNGHAEGVVDGVNVAIDYGRPNANDRQIWGGLVPFDEVWRTGANEATTISFDRDVMVEDTRVPAGTYALFTIPGEADCKIIFNSVAEQWGAFDYDASKDVASVSVPAQSIDPVETFEIAVEAAGVTLRWADRAYSFTVAAAP